MTQDAKIDLPRAVEEMRAEGERWREVFRVPDLSLGVYRLARGETDPQTPHAEDEIYYVLRGRGKIRIEDEDGDVAPGRVIFVKARARHRFHTVTEELALLVFFSPAEDVEAAKRLA